MNDNLFYLHHHSFRQPFRARNWDSHSRYCVQRQCAVTQEWYDCAYARQRASPAFSLPLKLSGAMREGYSLISLFILRFQQYIINHPWQPLEPVQYSLMGYSIEVLAVINYQSSSAKLRAAKTIFSVDSGSCTLLDRGGRAANLMDCRYLEVTCFLGRSSCKTGKFSFTYCDSDCFLTISFWFLDRHCMKPLEQLLVFSLRVYITLCSRVSSSSSRSSPSDSESEPPSYSSTILSSLSSFLISWMILRNSSFSWLRSRRDYEVSSVRIS